MKRYICSSKVHLVDSDEFRKAVELTARALENEKYDTYENYLERYGNYFGWEDSDRKMSSNQFEDCVTDYIEFGSHDIG